MAQNKSVLTRKNHLDAQKNPWGSYIGEDIMLKESRISGLNQENSTYPWVKQAFPRKLQELNFIGSCDPGELDRFLASCKSCLVSEETWISEASIQRN